MSQRPDLCSSAAGRPARPRVFCRRAAAPGRRPRGLTLLEVMVVLFIIGVMLSFAVLKVGDRGPSEALRREAQRFGALVAMAQEQAVLEAREYSVALSEDGYSFLSLEGERWQPISQDDLFRERQLPEGMLMELTAEELPVDLASSRQAGGFEEEDQQQDPQILVLSSGELTPFELVLYLDQTELAYRVEGQPDGSVTVERVESP